MNKAELISAVAEKTGLSKKDSEKAVNATFDTITDTLEIGDKVQLVGFGVFDVKQRGARVGRNPKTKEEIEIPASRVPQFKAGKLLKGRRFQISKKTCDAPQRFLIHVKEKTDADWTNISRSPGHQAPHRGQRGLRRRRVMVNGRPAKASYDVKAGDILEIALAAQCKGGGPGCGRAYEQRPMLRPVPGKFLNFPDRQ
jgi:DNA-binding protein HU-beta